MSFSRNMRKSLRSSKMVKQIVRDIFFLGQPSEPATQADLSVGRDLLDTLQANREACVGMAANMIGVKKNIIIVNMSLIDVVMFNPVIISRRGRYETEGMPMYVTYSDLIQIGIFIVTLIGLCYTIFGRKK